MKSEYRLGDLIEIKYGKDHKKLADGTIPVYGSGGIMRYADEYLYDNESILIPRKGTLNNIFYVTGKFWTVDTIFWSKINTDKVFGKFLYYYLITMDFAGMNVGSAVPSMTSKVLNEININLPSIDNQKKIAHILSTLDDKIELNRKMNQTLEEMAQALFKSWFVDFDLVHAKAGCTSDEELEQAAATLGVSKEVLELFPSVFVESEMGMIPEGWEVKPLDQIAHYQNGLALQKFRPKDEEKFLPVLKIAQLKKGYADGEEKADINIKPSCIVDNGDVVFSWSGSLVVDVWCGGKVALNQHLFKVTSEEYAKWFYYYWTKQHLMNFQRVAAAKAVTMGHIKRSHLAEALCVVPDDAVFDMAEKMINPLIEKLVLNRLEVNDLQKTRDTLLPKLLSGELDVSNMEVM